MTHASCARCQHGGFRHCPDGAPLPFALEHNCQHFRGRDARAPDAVPAPVEPGPVGLGVTARFRAWIAQVHADDKGEG